MVQLSREPGSANLYFHQNAYSADGQKLVITTPSGLSTVNLKTRVIDNIVKGHVGVLVTGRGVRNLVVKNCRFENTDNGLRIKSRRECGGIVKNIAYTDITMKNVHPAISIAAYYQNTTNAKFRGWVSLPRRFMFR